MPLLRRLNPAMPALRLLFALAILLPTQASLADNPRPQPQAQPARHAIKPVAGPATGTPLPTDATLRIGMENLRQIMAVPLADIQGNRLPREAYPTLALEVRAELAAIAQHSHPGHQAEPELRHLMARMEAGTRAMEGRPTGSRRQRGALQVIDALEHYSAHFDHPGWPGWRPAD